MLVQAKFWLLLVVLTGLLAVSSALGKWEAIDGPPVGIGTDISISVHYGTEYIYLTSGLGRYPYV